MKQKLLNLVDAFINGVHKVIQSPYRIVTFALTLLYARDLVTRAKGGPLDYAIDKFEDLSKVVTKMGFDILLLVVILFALVAVTIIKSKPGA